MYYDYCSKWPLEPCHFHGEESNLKETIIWLIQSAWSNNKFLFFSWLQIPHTYSFAHETEIWTYMRSIRREWEEEGSGKTNKFPAKMNYFHFTHVRLRQNSSSCSGSSPLSFLISLCQHFRRRCLKNSKISWWKVVAIFPTCLPSSEGDRERGWKQEKVSLSGFSFWWQKKSR